MIEIKGVAPHELPKFPDIDPLPDITNIPTLPPVPTPDIEVGDWKYFIVKVGVGHHISINPANYQDAEDVLVQDNSGIRARGRTSYGVSTCVVAFSHGATKAGVTVINNRFAHVDMCALSTQLAELVATRLPD